MDDLPFDFTRYLGQRLGLSSEQASNLLSSWLKDYEPASWGAQGTGSRSRAAAPEAAAYGELG
ncbi:MAG TPA: hypothetical protein VMI54_07860 [Polyangiaceae bacterium]|nr:hypothetical protein [Polyangiaceae bacterium]